MNEEKRKALADAIGYGVLCARSEKENLVESSNTLKEIVKEEAMLLGKTEIEEDDHDTLRNIGFLVEEFEAIISVGEEALAELKGEPMEGAPTYFSEEVKRDVE